ncbi:MAG: phytanoyl-CoA dioxygenase family protein [Pseudomonadota bacterium]
MKESFYGRIQQTKVDGDVARYVEEIAVRGFTVIPELFSLEQLTAWREKIDGVYRAQETDFGRDALIAIQELDMCRAPLLYDFEFIQLATHPLILSVVKEILGDWFILNLQNAIINRPNQMHHQSSWHRDLPYQNWVISRPLAINALVAIDEFSEITGGTHVVPFTHKTEVLPSDAYIDANRIVAAAPAGSAIVFDSMLFHRAGANRSSNIRRAVNHLYTTPILKQQYDFPNALGTRPDMDAATARLLGYTSQVPLNDRVWRANRAARNLGMGQNTQ